MKVDARTCSSCASISIPISTATMLWLWLCVSVSLTYCSVNTNASPLLPKKKDGGTYRYRHDSNCSPTRLGCDGSSGSGACSSSNSRSSIAIIRGGGPTFGEEEPPKLLKRRIDDDSTAENKSIFSSVGGLFRLNSEVKDDALPPTDIQQQKYHQQQQQKQQQGEEEMEGTVGDPLGRGGALTMVKGQLSSPPPTTTTTKPSSSYRQQRSKLDTSRVAAASSRLLPPESEFEQETQPQTQDTNRDDYLKYPQRRDVVQSSDQELTFVPIKRVADNVAKIWVANEWTLQLLQKNARKVESIAQKEEYDSDEEYEDVLEYDDDDDDDDDDMNKEEEEEEEEEENEVVAIEEEEDIEGEEIEEEDILNEGLAIEEEPTLGEEQEQDVSDGEFATEEELKLENEEQKDDMSSEDLAIEEEQELEEDEEELFIPSVATATVAPEELQEQPHTEEKETKSPVVVEARTAEQEGRQKREERKATKRERDQQQQLLLDITKEKQREEERIRKAERKKRRQERRREKEQAAEEQREQERMEAQAANQIVSSKKTSVEDLQEIEPIEEATPMLESNVTTLTSAAGAVVKPIEAKEQQQQDVIASAFTSSGYWQLIDKVASLGLSVNHPSVRLSRSLRTIRKATAQATGLHGVVSRKGRPSSDLDVAARASKVDATKGDPLGAEDLARVRRRIAAIDRARELVKQRVDADAASETARPKARWKVWARENKNNKKTKTADREPVQDDGELDLKNLTSERATSPVEVVATQARGLQEALEDQKREERLDEIDGLISSGQASLQELICEKDALQRRPNPMYNYTTSTVDGVERTTRQYDFPPQNLVEEYLEDLFSNGRLVKLNHTELWSSNDYDDDDDENFGEDLFTPSGNAHKLYRHDQNDRQRNGNNNGNGNINGGGGSWLLRQSIGKGGSLGSKIGVAAETSGYRAVCSSVMATLSQSLAGLHGTNLMSHSDIRLSLRQLSDLPPVNKNNVIPGSEGLENYAHMAIKNAMQKGNKKHRKRHSTKSKHQSHQTHEAFIQRDAVVETLLSHCQISAPLLKLFPLSWQRGLIGNMIDLITAVVTDFADGIQFQFLGHALTFSFKPLTEHDIISHFSMGGDYNSRRSKPEEFEAAVRATAEDVSEGLQFLDRWHERALGSGMLRAQIANLIARIVLTLTDEVLCGAKMDLWAAQANGPRLVAGLEYRTTPNSELYEPDQS